MKKYKSECESKNETLKVLKDKIATLQEALDNVRQNNETDTSS